MTDNLISTLEDFIKTEFLKQPDRELKADEALISSGLINSLSLIDLALFVEDTYGVQIDDTELNAETFDSLKELASLIKSRNQA
ncbi:MAG: acyl carrier protein [Anaerolineales bacterium]